MIRTHRNKPSHKRTEYSVAYMTDLVQKLHYPRVFNTKANAEARMIIYYEFCKIFGEHPKILGDSQNVVMGDPTTAKVIVGAHYDTVENTPGADDNSSALAVMLRIASLLHSIDEVCFVAFNGEECGLIGSKEFVNNISNHRIEQVHILEMVGYRTSAINSQKNPFGLLVDMPTVGDFIGVVSNTLPLMNQMMTVTYDQVKECVLRYHDNNAFYSMHRYNDPDHKAVIEMGPDAAPHLFKLMHDFPEEATLFAYHVIPSLIVPPQHIIDRMNTEAVSSVGNGGFVGLSVPKMAEIYHQWGMDIGVNYESL